MVLSEVAKDPPSPFLTVQSSCDGLLPLAPPPALSQQQHLQQQPSPGVNGSTSSNSSWSCSSQGGNVHSFSSQNNRASHLQSIVSQQSLNFSVPPDSPFEFEAHLHSIAAASAASDGGQHTSKQQQQHAAAAGHNDLLAQQQRTNGTTLLQAEDSSSGGGGQQKNGVLRFLPLGQHGWLRATQSLPQCHLPSKRQHPSDSHHSSSVTDQAQELSFKQIRHVLEKDTVAGGPEEQQQHQDLQQLHLQPVLSRRIKTRVHKLLQWAKSGKSASASNSPHIAPPTATPLAAHGSLTFAAAVNGQPQQQQQHVPVPWQHQVFTEQPSIQGHVQLINTTPGTPPPLRSPRSSLVSVPSSCDCPLLVGRYSSAGSDGGYARSPNGVVGAYSSSLGCSQSCSLTPTPSPSRMSAGGSSAPVVTRSISASGCASTPSGPETSSLLRMTSSVRVAHHRHRLHRPTCKHYHLQQAQQQQQAHTQPGAAVVGGQLQHQLSQLPQPTGTPSSPSIGGLAPQSSLRTALQQLESMASLKAARIMDKLNAGLQKVTSHRVFDGVLRHGITVGKEVMRDWELGPPLGVGASCVTRLVTDKLSGRTAACKSISKQGIMHSAVVKASLLAVQREVAILQAVVGHPHVVALHAVYEDVHNLHMIMDWCGGGSLWQLMERCPGYMLPESAAAAATKATLEVLAHCHARGVMHRDIKPDNLLIARPLDGPQQLSADEIKVSDFGISVPLTPGQVLTELAGTMGYMAPEVLRRSYTESADVWSTGVMLYEMVCGQLPFNLGNTCEECLAYIEEAEVDLSGPAWQAVSEDARCLVTAMLAKDPAQRPSAQALLLAYSSWLSKGNLPSTHEQQEKEPQLQAQQLLEPQPVLVQ